MTNTTIINGVTIGAAANPASNQTKTTLQSTTTVYSMSASITNGARQGMGQRFAVLWHAVSPFSVTAAQAVAQLRQQARRFELIPNAETPAAVQIIKCDVEQADGLYHYCWLDEPLMHASSTLSVILTEM